LIDYFLLLILELEAYKDGPFY